MLNISDLLHYNEIVIQCHDNPDADAIASGFALYTYLTVHGKQVRLIYSGYREISKPNLKLFVSSLNIPLEYVNELVPPRLLVTVDSQVNGGNITFFEALNYCSIDHHIQTTDLVLSDVRPYLGSCSTLVWDLLFAVDFDVNEYPNIATALYYGLLTDTNFLSEISHPLDKDMLDMLQIDNAFIRQLKNSNLSMLDLETAGIALIRCSLNHNHHFAVLEARPCDPNILGFISDLAIQVDHILTCVVYFHSDSGIKFSVRSCTKEVKANEFAQFLADGIGSGGGHIDKAGGFIDQVAFREAYKSANAETFFHNATADYFENFDIIHASNYNVDISDMLCYVKKDVVVGYTPSTSIFAPGTSVRIRTLEGDLDFIVSSDIYIIVGIEGEAQPIHKEKFERSYRSVDRPLDISFQYNPVVKNKQTGESVELINYIQACVTTSAVPIYAKPLTKNVKIFTLWNAEQYLSGFVGDYLVAREDDFHDIYVIRKDIFHKTYSPKHQ